MLYNAKLLYLSVISIIENDAKDPNSIKNRNRLAKPVDYKTMNLFFAFSHIYNVPVAITSRILYYRRIFVSYVFEQFNMRVEENFYRNFSRHKSIFFLHKLIRQ